MSNEQRNDLELEVNGTEISDETARIQATGAITVSWEKDKQMNDIWRTFDLIACIVFTAWHIKRTEAESIAKQRAKEEYVPSKARSYSKAAGSITFTDDGKIG